MAPVLHASEEWCSARTLGCVTTRAFSFDAGRTCSGSQLKEGDRIRGSPSIRTKTAAVSECQLVEADTSGVADRAQGVREVLPALKPVKPAYPEEAGPSSGNFGLGTKLVLAWVALNSAPIQRTPDSL